jgi:hypothetical protein
MHSVFYGKTGVTEKDYDNYEDATVGRSLR